MALLLLFVLAVVRCPSIFVHGRVWAEESTVFLLSSWNRGFFPVLFAPHFGYYSVWDNLFGDIATHWIPLSLASFLALPIRTGVNYRAEPWRQQVLRWEQDPTLPLQPNPTWWTAIHLDAKR